MADSGRNTVLIRRYDAACGSIFLGALEGRICLCDWRGVKPRDAVDRRLQRLLNARFADGGSEVTDEAARQLDHYFAGKRNDFDLPLLFAGTDFQKGVWNALRQIAYGSTVSYAELAERLGAPNAVRAVANANGANALSILVPCHRVVGSDGSPTGYAGGVDAKRYLLELETRYSAGV